MFKIVLYYNQVSMEMIFLFVKIMAYCVMIFYPNKLCIVYLNYKSLDVCQSNPCRGECTIDSSLQSGFKCTCPNGFLGVLCDKSKFFFKFFNHFIYPK
jgi:hypothetical protein